MTLTGLQLLYNHYETLGIKPSATQKDIKAAFIRLSKKFHPDVNKKDPRAHEKFIAVNNAYNVLCKPNTRHQYDIKSGIVYRPMSRPQQHYSRYVYRHYNEEEFYHYHNNLFNKFRSNHRLQCRLPFYYRVFVLTVCILLAGLKLVDDINKSVERKKKKKKTVEYPLD